MYDALSRHLKGATVTKHGNVARDTGVQTVQNFRIVMKELTNYFSVRIQKRCIRRFPENRRT